MCLRPVKYHISFLKLISLLYVNSVEKKNAVGPSYPKISNKDKNEIKLLDDPLKDKKLSKYIYLLFCFSLLSNHY